LGFAIRQGDVLATAQISKKIEEPKHKQKIEFIDAHCHIDMLSDEELDAALALGVTAMVVNGVDTPSNISVLNSLSRNGIFAALGIHPEKAISIKEDELEYNINMIKENRSVIKAIGEIGLDYTYAKTEKERERQKEVFRRFVQLAIELGKPVSVHSREAIDDTLEILEREGPKLAHLHFFEGGAVHAKKAESLGFMISVPPLHSTKRMEAIEKISIDNLMAETDSPTAGMHVYDIDKSVMLIAKAKGIDFEDCAIAVADNTKRFFNIGLHNLIRRI